MVKRASRSKSGHYAKSAAKAGQIICLDEQIDLMLGVWLVITLLRLGLITLGWRAIRLLALLGVTVVSAGLAQLMLLADLVHFPLDLFAAGRGRRRGKMGNNRSGWA